MRDTAVTLILTSLQEWAWSDLPNFCMCAELSNESCPVERYQALSYFAILKVTEAGWGLGTRLLMAISDH